MKKILTAALVFMFTLVAAEAKEKKEKTQTEPFDRGIGIPSSIFVPKGTVGFGATFSYNTYDVGKASEDYGFSALFGMVNNMHGSVVTGGVSPHVSYFVANNLSVGGRFNFDRTQFDVGSASLSLTQDMSFGINDFHYLKDAYSGALFARYFVPFGNSKRFAMFTELRASAGYAQSETYNLTELDKNGTYQDIYDFQVGIIPGITAFMTNEVALEVAVNLVGINYQKIVQYTNNVGISEMESSGANFKINLLQISLGISCYLPTGHNKVKKAKKK